MRAFFLYLTKSLLGLTSGYVITPATDLPELQQIELFKFPATSLQELCTVHRHRQVFFKPSGALVVLDTRSPCEQQ